MRINGRDAKPIRSNFAEWEIEFDDSAAKTVSAHAEDEAGNLEQRGHVRAFR